PLSPQLHRVTRPALQALGSVSVFQRAWESFCCVEASSIDHVASTSGCVTRQGYYSCAGSCRIPHAAKWVLLPSFSPSLRRVCYSSCVPVPQHCILSFNTSSLS